MKSKKYNFVEKNINFLLNILIAIFAIILLISIYTGVQTKILGNNYTNFFGYSIFEVQTGSMADTINAGDWIIVKITQKVKLDDIVTYELDGEYITHRIISAFKGTYITKGDANNAKDDPVDQSQMVGKVVKVLANFGIIKKTIFNPSVLIALIITLFLIDFTFKKNMMSSTRSNTPKKDREDDISMIIDTIIKKSSLMFDAIVKKVVLLYEKARKFIGNKKVKSNSISRTEIRDLESYKATYDFNKVKEPTPKAEVEDYYTDEDELDKTSLYRVIPVDAPGMDDRFKELAPKVGVEDYYTDEDELDKTSLYRVIPVDLSEIDETFLEIAKNEIKGTEQKNGKQEKSTIVEQKPEEKKDEVIEEETLTKLNLDLIEDANDKRKGKNVIDTVMLIKREELENLINSLIKDDKAYIDKPTIKDIFITAYIDAKFYNYYGDRNIEYCGKNVILKIEEVIEKVGSELISDYHGNDKKHGIIVEKYTNLLILIANLEHGADSITDSKAKNEFYKKEIEKYSKDWDISKIEYVITEIIKIQKDYADSLECFMKKLETNMFNLNFNKLVNRKDMYGLELQHNINFSKVYSGYIIDKTYTEGIIGEDKMSVLLTLLLVQLIKDMTLSDFNKKYILYIPKSLYTKEKKLEKLLRMIDDRYAKDNVIILIAFEDLLYNKQIVKEVRKMGYKFALVFDKETVIKENDRGNMYIADYIFVNKKVVNMVDILSFIPEELLDKVIYEDIADKVGDFGGE